MAKKIKLDFSKTEERSGWNTKQIPEGLHKMKIDAVQVTEASDGTAMLVYALVPTENRLKTRRFPFYCKLQANQLWKLRDLFVAAGLTVPKKSTMIDPEAPVGKFVAAEAEDETQAAYAGRTTINATYGLDILDEDDDDTSSEGEDEEEYEDEEDDSEEEYDDSDEDEDDDEEEDDEEEDEDDEDEDLDEDDDLDDEDLEDELDEDDEDEEEEPAPKRRAPAKKAPAKKAPAKAAPKAAPKKAAAKAPAKRVVKRSR